MELRLYVNAEGDLRWFAPGEEPSGYAEKKAVQAEKAAPAANKARRTRTKSTESK